MSDPFADPIADPAADQVAGRQSRLGLTTCLRANLKLGDRLTAFIYFFLVNLDGRFIHAIPASPYTGIPSDSLLALAHTTRTPLTPRAFDSLVHFFWVFFEQNRCAQRCVLRVLRVVRRLLTESTGLNLILGSNPHLTDDTMTRTPSTLEPTALNR